MSLTQKKLREALWYNPKTDKWIWRIDRGRARVGNKAGYSDGGYRVIRLYGQNYHASRLAVFYMTGEWPDGNIKHSKRKR